MDFAFGYERIPATSWAYLSSLLMLALFFKFNRIWALRNFDLILLILLAPGLLMVFYPGNLAGVPRPSTSVSPMEVPAQLPLPLENSATSSPGDSGRSPVEGQSGVGSAAPEFNGGSPTEPPALDAVPTAGSPPADATQDKTAQPPNSGESVEPKRPGAAQQVVGAPPAAISDPNEPKPITELSQADWTRRNGFIWLFGVGLMLLVRMLLDPLLVRRPLLEPNLSSGGLVFLGISMLSVSIANIVVTTPSAEELSGAESGMRILQRVAAGEAQREQLSEHGPGYALFHALVVSTVQSELVVVAKVLAIVGQVALVLGLVYIGYHHFNNFRIGVGIAVIYLMLPYTSLFSGHVIHLLPAALIVWAIALYRQPIWSGVMIGLATGVSYYPFFLLPLWVSFYWDRGVWRFVLGTVAALVIGVGGLVFTSADVADFVSQLQRMFGFWLPRVEGLTGIWSLGWDPWFRLPIVVAFIVLSVSFVFWPLRKNVGALIAYTSALMVSVQFWHGYEGGTHMAWYLPLCLMVFFRPNLSERFANTEIRDRSHRRRYRVDAQQDVISAA